MTESRKPVDSPQVGETVVYDCQWWGDALFVLSPRTDTERPFRKLCPGTELTDFYGQRFLVAQEGLVRIGGEEAGTIVPWHTVGTTQIFTITIIR